MKSIFQKTAWNHFLPSKIAFKKPQNGSEVSGAEKSLFQLVLLSLSYRLRSASVGAAVAATALSYCCCCYWRAILSWISSSLPFRGATSGISIHRSSKKACLIQWQIMDHQNYYDPNFYYHHPTATQQQSTTAAIHHQQENLSWCKKR